MKAVRIHEYGNPSVLVYEDVPRPQPKSGEVLVRIHAAGVGVWDPEIRRGEWREMIDYPLPLILGTDVAAKSRRWEKVSPVCVSDKTCTV